MKKLFVISALALFGLANAQIEKGTWLIEGKTGLGFNNVSTQLKKGNESIDGPKVSTFSISPNVGYFVADNLAIGLELNYLSITTKSKSYIGYRLTERSEEESKNTLTLLPNLTYYFPTSTNLKPYIGAGIGFGSITEKDWEGKETASGFAWGAKGGAVYMLNNSIAFNLGLSYGQLSLERNNITNKANTFGANAGISIFLK